MTMQRPGPGMRLGAVLATIAVVGALVAGCSPGLQGLRGEPRFQSGAMAGVNTRIGPILLRNIYVDEPNGELLPRGSNGRMYLHLFNVGETADALVAVTTPAAESTVLHQDRSGEGRLEPVTTLPLPAGVDPIARSRAAETWGVEPPGFYVLLSRLTESLRPGESIPVSFTFAHAGTTTVFVPIEIPTVAGTDK